MIADHLRKTGGTSLYIPASIMNQSHTEYMMSKKGDEDL